MANDLFQLLQQSRATVDALIADGANPDDTYQIEHHLCSADFTKLEKAAVELVKVGYHVDDADEFELDDGSRLFAFVAVSRVKLDAELLQQQTHEVTQIADLVGVDYDGWGTYFGDEEE